MWDADVGDEFEGDERFRWFMKKTPDGLAWAVTRVKAEMRGAFEAVADAEDEESVWGVVEGWRVAIEACVESVPEWADEFEEQVNAKLRKVWWKNALAVDVGDFWIPPDVREVRQHTRDRREWDDAVMAIPPKFEVRRATRSMRNVIIGIAGAAGGGKTCSSLRLAKGLAGAGSVVLIDTEQGKSTQYAPRGDERVPDEFDPDLPLFDYQIIDLPPPHNPERFRFAVNAAARIKPAVLIIDNITDEMHGTGGQIEMKENPPPSDPYGWQEPKRQHKALMNALRQRPWYVILTIRAGEKQRPPTKEEKRAQGHSGFVDEGWQPQCDRKLYFDCTLLQLVDGGVPNGSEERPWKFPPSLRRYIPAGQPFDEAMGRRIAEWCQPQGTWEGEE